MFKEFKEFALKGNLVDIAVGLAMGVAFGVLVGSFVADIFSPPLGLLLGGVDFANMFIVLREGSKAAGPYASAAAAKEAGAVILTYGVFINALINFLIVSFVMFLIVKAMNSMKRPAAVAPAGPTPDQLLLTEIRDLLRRQ